MSESKKSSTVEKDEINALCALETTSAFLIDVVKDETVPDNVRIKAAIRLIACWSTGSLIASDRNGCFIPYVKLS